jgi:hypothetical protein
MTYNNKLSTEEQWQHTYENAATARRVTLVGQSGTNIGPANPLPVTVTSASSGTSINLFSSTVVAAGNTITLVSYTVPATKSFKFTGGIVGGGEQALFTFDIGGNTIAQIRNSGSNPTIRAELLEKPTASAGTVVSIIVENLSPKSRTFEATLSGVLI